MKQHKRPYACDLPTCSRDFSLRVDLDRHKRSVHGICEELEKLYCNVVGCKYHQDGYKWFTRKDHLRRHIKIHNSPTTHQNSMIASTAQSPRDFDSIGNSASARTTMRIGSGQINGTQEPRCRTAAWLTMFRAKAQACTLLDSAVRARPRLRGPA